MIYSLRRGSNTPTVDDLHLYELGWETTNKRLYIKDDAGIKRLNTIVKLNGLFNTDPDFYAPTAVTANGVLKTKASWTLGQDPFEYVSIDDTVTADSTNLITSGAVSSALTALQSTINEALNNKSEIGHIHEIDDVTNLRTELNEKLPASLDIPIAELNNHSLREVFEDGNLLLNSISPYSNINNWIAFLSTVSIANDMIKITPSQQFGGIRQTVSGLTIGNNIWVSLYLETTGLTNIELWEQAGIQTLMQKSVSGRYSFDRTLTNATSIRFNTAQPTTTQQIHYIKDLYMINRSSLGISSLTVEEMDYWFSAFTTLKDIESIQGNVFVSNTDPGTPPRADSLWFHI